MLLEKLYDMEGFDYEQMLIDYLGYAERLRPYVKDTNYTVQTLVREGKNVLLKVPRLLCSTATTALILSSHRPIRQQAVHV